MKEESRPKVFCKCGCGQEVPQKTKNYHQEFLNRVHANNYNKRFAKKHKRLHQKMSGKGKPIAMVY